VVKKIADPWNMRHLIVCSKNKTGGPLRPPVKKTHDQRPATYRSPNR
jgi:hypothetical protein